VQKRPSSFIVALFSDTIEHRNLKFGTVVAGDRAFQNECITLHEGQRSSEAINPAKFGIFAENALFSPATMVNV